jgi:hypothetical protein
MRALRLPSPVPPASFPSPSVHPPFSSWSLRASHVPRCPLCTLAVPSDLGRIPAAGVRWRVSDFGPFDCLTGSHFLHGMPTQFRCCPRYSDNEGSPAMPISRLNHTAFALAVYASCRGFPTTSKTRFQLAANLCRMGLFTHGDILKGFIIMAPVAPPFLGLAWRDGIQDKYMVYAAAEFQGGNSHKRISCCGSSAPPRP